MLKIARPVQRIDQPVGAEVVKVVIPVTDIGSKVFEEIALTSSSDDVQTTPTYNENQVRKNNIEQVKKVNTFTLTVHQIYLKIN